MLVEQHTQEYARLRQEAAAAAALVAGPVSERVWEQVCLARDAAMPGLAVFDEARLAVSTAHLDMMVHNANPTRLRQVVDAGIATREINMACGRYGPEHVLVQRLRAIRGVANRAVGLTERTEGRAQAKAARSADKAAKAVRKHGLDSMKALLAEGEYISLLTTLRMPEDAAARACALLDNLPDDGRRSGLAVELSMTCYDLGQPEAAAHCHDIHYARQNAWFDENLSSLTGAEEMTARFDRLAMQIEHGKLTSYTGRPADAEPMLRDALAMADELASRVHLAADTTLFGQLHATAWATLAGTLIALDRAPHAHECYQRAFDLSAHSAESVARSYLLGAVHTSREWPVV